MNRFDDYEHEELVKLVHAQESQILILKNELNVLWKRFEGSQKMINGLLKKQAEGVTKRWTKKRD